MLTAGTVEADEVIAIAYTSLRCFDTYCTAATIPRTFLCDQTGPSTGRTVLNDIDEQRG